MYRILIALSFFFSTHVFAAPLWEDIDKDFLASTKQLRVMPSESASPAYNAVRRLLLDERGLHQILFTATAKENKSVNGITSRNTIFNLPLPDGSMLPVTATEYSIMSQTLADKFPQFKSWKIEAMNGKNIQGSINFTAMGFHAMLMLENGDTVFIDPDKLTTAVDVQEKQSKRRYNSFSKRENQHLFQRAMPIKEILIQKLRRDSKKVLKPQAKAAKALLTYQLALAATAEYTILNGGTKEKALSAMYITIDRVNTIYQRDLAIKLELVGTDKLIYLNSQSDPYTNADAYAMIQENIANLDAVIGVNNYDIGHLFGGAGTGGLALLSGVCRTETGAHKAGGVTGSSSPNGSTFDIDYVAHEIGHQLGATHTFNSTKGNCGNGNREASASVEPGSGSTIMSYAGICNEDNLQIGSDAVFHAVSIEQIHNYTRNEAGCGTFSNTMNNAPTLAAVQSYHIPKDTPFVLTAYADDSDISVNGIKDSLTYTWDELDISETTVELGIDSGTNPLFRSHLPSSANQRYFPELKTLFDGFPIRGEVMPQTSRELNFATSVRDGKGGITRRDSQIIISGNPFKITSHTSSYVYHPNDEIEIRWNEAGTSWSPINCNLVDIKLLTEDSTTQDLLLKTANDGTETIILSELIHPVTNARLMVACSDNIFFALSQGSITVANAFEEVIPPIASVNSPSIIEGDNGSKLLNYIINLTKSPNEDATIEYMINDVVSNELMQTGTVNISTGQTSATISQLILGDRLVEEDENYRLTLFSPQNIQFNSLDNLITYGIVIDNDRVIEPDSIETNNISTTEENYGISNDNEEPIAADKVVDTKASAGGSFDGILTFLLIYISLLHLKFKARKYRKVKYPKTELNQSREDFPV